MVFSRRHDVQERTGEKLSRAGTSAGEKLPPVALRLKKKWGGRKELGMEEKMERARAMRAHQLAERQAAAGSVNEKVLRALSTRKMRISSTAFSHVEKMTSAESRRERSRLATIAQGAKFGTHAVSSARKACQVALLKKRERSKQRQQDALFARHKHLEEKGQGLRLRRAESRQRFLERLGSKRARLQQQLERATERRAAALAKRTRHAHVSAKRAQEALSRLQSKAKALAARVNRAQNRASLKRSTTVAARRLVGAAKRAALWGRWMKKVGDLTARIARDAQVHGPRREERIAERREQGRTMGTVRVAEAVARKCTRAILSQALSAHAQTLAASRRLSLTSSRVSTARQLGSVRCQHVADRNSAAKKAAFERFVGKLVDASARRLAHKRTACARAAAMGSGAVIQGRERLAVKLQKIWVNLESRLEAATERREATIARVQARAQTSRARLAHANTQRARAQKAAAFRLETKLENARARRSETLARAAARAKRSERRRAWARGFGVLKSAAIRRGLEKRKRRAEERRAVFLATRPGNVARSGRRLEGSVEGRVAELDQRLMWAAMNRARHVASVKEAARRTARPRVSSKPVMQTQIPGNWEAKRERALRRCATRVRRKRAQCLRRDAFFRARRLSADHREAAATAAAQQLQAWRAAGKARASQENAAKRRHVSLEATRSKAGKSVARHLDVVNQQRVRLAEVKNGILERQEKRVSEGGKRREELLVARRARAQESAAFSLRAVTAH
ncbi:hypothetical protein KFL_000350150 [Klebsormidium nitens]|uniref:Uncharacterized protein n=1 Tax=Klebsormidium nitens TaxID=105231 RepID=A0A1Y1HR54_KLENI|nr:hypothetical protein KFL_000350150 [Klebsormidium nitens]|eukprot:GAQ79659.1 hypothetical protein KFL_000350150 [Klebsormidium nitens]